MKSFFLNFDRTKSSLQLLRKRVQSLTRAWVTTTNSSVVFALTVFFACLLLTACGTTPRDPLEIEDLKDPQVPGIQDARYWADATPENLNDLLRESERQRRASGLSGDYNTLALSGGGENGAFAAGILAAWTASGTRPEFLSVTGVSTGALAAPFAFLGSEYDDELRRLYGGLQTDEIISFRGVLQVLPNASVVNPAPLKQLIEEYVTDEFLAKISAEHKKGRRLVVQTVSLDAQRPVIWNLGVIASSGAPNAKQLFRDVLLASASIPGIFPPVFVEVETPAGVRDELHVDGGVISQSAFAQGWQIPDIISGRSTLYAIRNGKVTPEPDILEPRIFSIMNRSLLTLVKAQGTDDLRLAFKRGKRTNTDFRAAWIGSDFDFPLDTPFDPEYMRALYQYGYDRFQSGRLWSTEPP